MSTRGETSREPFDGRLIAIAVDSRTEDIRLLQCPVTAALDLQASTGHQHYNSRNQPCEFVALYANTVVKKEGKGIEPIEFKDARWENVRRGMRHERRECGNGPTFYFG